MFLGLSLALTSVRRRARRVLTNFLPLGSDALITADGKVFLAREV